MFEKFSIPIAATGGRFIRRTCMNMSKSLIRLRIEEGTAENDKHLLLQQTLRYQIRISMRITHIKALPKLRSMFIVTPKPNHAVIFQIFQCRYFHANLTYSHERSQLTHVRSHYCRTVNRCF